MAKFKKKKSIPFSFGEKHKRYIRACQNNTYNIAEGAVRAGKTVDNVFAFAQELKRAPDRVHLATGSTVANAKLNIGDANGFGLEHIFRGQCKWGKYKDNEALIIKGPMTRNRTKIIIFAGGAKADSFKKIRGNSYGMWIATEINLHHDNTIKEATNRTIASKNRKIFWDLNPDNPNASIYTQYIDIFAEKSKKNQFIGGYNYEHFTIDDNVNITEQRKREIKSQYEQGSVWYKRDIEGLRIRAEGLIYKSFAEHSTDFIIPKKDVPKHFISLTIGVDIGGNKSYHAFVATGITINYGHVIVLASERIDPNGTPEDLNKAFLKFLKKVIRKYGTPTEVRFESAEQVLKRGVKNAILEDKWLTRHNISVPVFDCLKTPIKGRIDMTASLMANNRLLLTEDCDSLISALSSAVWDPKEELTNKRLDDGSSDIDTLDAFEYSFEKHISNLQFAYIGNSDDEEETEIIEDEEGEEVEWA